MGIVVSAENVSKAYQLGQINTGTLSNDLKRWYAKKRGKEDPFLQVGEENERATKSNSNVVWSLKDVTFDIMEGDSLGIVGRNGAGKSTLLKLLSQITSPTLGHIKIKGKIASLLEVGTGFHPELSGRENIYLNGAILAQARPQAAARAGHTPRRWRSPRSDQVSRCPRVARWTSGPTTRAARWHRAAARERRRGSAGTLSVTPNIPPRVPRDRAIVREWHQRSQRPLLDEMQHSVNRSRIQKHPFNGSFRCL